MYILIYLYVCVYKTRRATPNPPTNIVDFRGFDSSIILIQRGGIRPRVSVKKKHSAGENDRWKDRLSERQIRGWRAVSTAGLHGQGSHKRCCFRDTAVKGIMDFYFKAEVQQTYERQESFQRHCGLLFQRCSQKETMTDKRACIAIADSYFNVEMEKSTVLCQRRNKNQQCLRKLGTASRAGADWLGWRSQDYAQSPY